MYDLIQNKITVKTELPEDVSRRRKASEWKLVYDLIQKKITVKTELPEDVVSRRRKASEWKLVWLVYSKVHKSWLINGVTEPDARCI